VGAAGALAAGAALAANINDTQGGKQVGFMKIGGDQATGLEQVRGCLVRERVGATLYASVHEGEYYATDLSDGSSVAQAAREGSMSLSKHALYRTQRHNH